MKIDKIQLSIEKNDGLSYQLAIEDRIRKDIAHRESLKLIKINDSISIAKKHALEKDEREKQRLSDIYKENLLSSKLPITKKRLRKAVKEAVKVLKKLSSKGYKADSNRVKKLYNNFIHRVDLSNHFINHAIQTRTKNGNFKNFTKTATANFRDVSYLAKSKGKNSRQALSNSIKHLVRLLEDREYSHVEELVQNNLYVFNGENYTLNSIEERKELLSKIEIEIKVQEELFFKTRKNSKRAKSELEGTLHTVRKKRQTLLKLFKDFPESQHLELKSEIQNFVNSFKIDKSGFMQHSSDEQVKNANELYKKIRPIFEDYYEHKEQRSEKHKIKLINDRSNNILGFIEVYNNAVDKKKETFKDSHSYYSAAVPLYKEFIFKIPHHVGQIDCNQQDYIDSATSYFSKHFPEYEILLSAVHFDEPHLGMIDKDENNSNIKISRTGDHIHMILKTRNMVTGSYDFATKYRNFGMECAKELKPLEFTPNPDSKSLSDKDLVRVGQAINYKFMQHMQDNLFSKLNICLTLLSSEEKLDLHNLMSTLEQNRPQNERITNTLRMNQANINQMRNDIKILNNPNNQVFLKNLIEAKKPENQALIQNYNEAKKPESLKLIRYFNQVRRYIKEEETRLDNLKNTNNSNSIIIKKQSEKIEEMVSVNAVLNEWTISLSNDLSPIERFELATKTAQTIGDILTDQDFKYDIIDIILKIEEDYKIQSNDKVSNKITNTKKLKI